MSLEYLTDDQVIPYFGERLRPETMAAIQQDLTAYLNGVKTRFVYCYGRYRDEVTTVTVCKWGEFHFVKHETEFYGDDCDEIISPLDCC